MNALDPMFPVSDDMKGLAEEPRGILIRDAVALHCLQGILANADITKKGHSTTGGPTRAAEMAYQFADALIEASKIEPSTE